MLLFPSPGDLPKQGIDLGSPAMQADSLPTELQGKLMEYNSAVFYFKPTMSQRKHKRSCNIGGSTILFLKVCLVAQLCSTLATYEL